MNDDKSTARWFKENIEAIAIAVVMALVIRQFLIEAFKIPTESMAPTLLGDHLGGGIGDRILVDKMPAITGHPARWSVIVFKYPLNESKNYIKRLIGLGGETLTIRDGDIFINGKIERKPEDVQDVLFFPVYPGVLGKDEEKNAWEGDWNRFKRVGAQEYRGDCPGKPSFLRYFEPVTDARPWAHEEHGVNRVGDVRLRFTVTPQAVSGSVADGRVIVRIVENRITNELDLAVGKGKSYVRHGDEKWDLEDVALPSGDDTDVSFANVDDTLVVSVDGHEFRHDYPSLPPADYDHEEDSIRFGLARAKADFSDLRLDRDEYYTSMGLHRDIHIPKNCFFVLGDNSRRSADSREWTEQTFETTDKKKYYRDGEHRDDGDTSGKPVAGPGQIVFQDIHGIWRVLDKSKILDLFPKKFHAPFVPRKNLIGRAFLVFWPLNPFNGQFRLKFIR